MTFWDRLASFILKNRILILAVIVSITGFLGYNIKYMRISYEEANMLPSDHSLNVKYDKFLDIFGEEGNLIIVGVKDDAIFELEKFNKWLELCNKIENYSEIENSISIANLTLLQKDGANKKFIQSKFINNNPKTQSEVDLIKTTLFDNLPLYENLLYNKKTGTLQAAFYVDKEIVNTKKRRAFILDVFIPMIKTFEKDNDLNIHVSGLPYIRTLNAKNITNEMGIFLGLAASVTAIIFFLFFRSVRATLISLLTVTIGVVWAFGFMGWFRFEISVLTSILPPLIIVIGIPNAIFIINKYQQEIKKHSDKQKSLHTVISKIGFTTLLTNMTTACGFAAFAFTKSQLLSEFGIIASINIIGIFILSLIIIPISYSFLAVPKTKHLKHLDKQWMKNIVRWMENIVRNNRSKIYIISGILIILSTIGASRLKISGSMLEDMPKSADFFKDIKFFEREFGGIMPVEILVNTKKKEGIWKSSTIKRVDKLSDKISEIPFLTKSLSYINFLKYSRQAYFGGDSKYYKAPSSQEKNFIFNYFKNSDSEGLEQFNSYVDSTGTYLRITTYIKDGPSEQMENCINQIEEAVSEIFPNDKYEIELSGKAMVFLEGTNYLIKNLLVSLTLAIILISIAMGVMFKSKAMVLISVIPNLLPLLITAGLMGYFGVPLKPSTILVFSVAFGISVDDTIHFLAKLKQELSHNGWNIHKAVYVALRETGVSMFYTSIVLFFGFLVFVVSSFGGTQALGSLVSVTLIIAMISNLLLLPGLILTFRKYLKLKN
ncbi:MAG: MMPL family transporter [Flavobacteriaceae bacterium]|nr:MMPL family transporter [Flavobacteriaceae bacterium]